MLRRILMFVLALCMLCTLSVADIPQTTPETTLAPAVTMPPMEDAEDALDAVELPQMAQTGLVDLSLLDLSVYTQDELEAFKTRIDAQLLLRGKKVYFGLERGSSGEDVLKLQQRLSDLGYLDGTLTGKYNSQTQQAMKRFEKNNDLEADGVASPDDQALLFSDAAVPTATKAPTEKSTKKPEPTVDPQYAEFVDLDYEEASRYPESWLFKGVVLKGKVVQVLGNRTKGFQIRLELTGTNDVVYLFVDDPGYNILVDDRLTVYARMGFPVTYETVRGDEITIPSANVLSILLR